MWCYGLPMKQGSAENVSPILFQRKQKPYDKNVNFEKIETFHKLYIHSYIDFSRFYLIFLNYNIDM